MNVKFSKVEDYYFGVNGQWDYYKDQDTGESTLNPIPSEIEMNKIYSNYYTHSDKISNKRNLISDLEEIINNELLGYSLNMEPLQNPCNI